MNLPPSRASPERGLRLVANDTRARAAWGACLAERRLKTAFLAAGRGHGRGRGGATTEGTPTECAGLGLAPLHAGVNRTETSRPPARPRPAAARAAVSLTSGRRAAAAVLLGRRRRLRRSDLRPAPSAPAFNGAPIMNRG